LCGGKPEIAVRGRPTSPDKAGVAKAVTRVFGSRNARPNSLANVTYLIER
jgi:hypothetical protein